MEFCHRDGGRDLTTRRCQDRFIHNVIALEIRIKSELWSWKVDAEWVPHPLAEDRKFFLTFLLASSGHLRANYMAHWIAKDISMAPVPIDTAIHKSSRKRFPSHPVD